MDQTLLKDKEESQDIIDLRDKSPEEVVNIYNDIAVRNEYLRELWEQTGDYDTAVKVYKETNEKSDK